MRIHSFNRIGIVNNTFLFSPLNPLSIWQNFPNRKLPRIAYIGWLSNQNFGDDILAQIAKKQLNKYWIQSAYPHFRLEDSLAAKIYGKHNVDLIVIGGGTLIGGSYAERILELSEKDVPILTFGTGVIEEADWKNSFQKEQWREILLKASAVSVRGNISCSTLSTVLDFNSSHVVGDFALQAYYLQKPEENTGAKNSKIKIGINLGSHKHKRNSSEQSAIDLAVSEFMAQTSESVEFSEVSMHRIDEEKASFVFSLAGKNPVSKIRLNRKPSQMSMLGDLDLVISQRLHGSILSHSYGVPAIGLEYAGKIRDHFSLMDQEKYCVPIKSISSQKISETVQSLIPRIKEEQNLIQAKRDEIILRQKDFISDFF